MQNLPRGGNLRRALIAPPNHSIVTADAAQIEARIVAWICGQWDLVNDFADGVDVYAKFASEIFGYLVSKKSHPKERFMGKTAILGLGYQVGGTKFQNTIEVQSKLQLGTKIEMSPQQAADIVEFYRAKYQDISSTWKRLQDLALPVLGGNGGKFTLGPCEFEEGAVRKPNGLRLHYHQLARRQSIEGFPEWMFMYGAEPKKLYGGKLLENIVQSLAADITMGAALRIQKRFPLAMQVHDELVYVVPDDDVEEVKTFLKKEMTTPPAWAPELPLAADIGVGKTYGDAK